MDDVNQAAEGTRAPSPVPFAGDPGKDCFAAFVPLRLVLQPGGPVMQLDRPDMLIGRHSNADLRLPLPDVSRRHCRFVFTNGCWHVFDLHSLNGVYVNAERVERATLHDHDMITIGGFHFRVELDGASHLQATQECLDCEGMIQKLAAPATDSHPEGQRKAS